MAGQWTKTDEPCVYQQSYTRTDPRTARTIKETRYKAAFRALSDGKPVVTSRTFKHKKDAVAFVAKTRVNTREGAPAVDVSKSKVTVADVWTHLRETWDRKPSTLASYEARWTRYIGPAIGSRKIAQVRRAELIELFADVQKRATLDTRRKVQQIVSKLFSVAMLNEWIVHNPAKGIPLPGAQVQRQPWALTDDQVSAIAAEVSPRYRALVWTLAETGMRVGEAVALRVKNLNGSIKVTENAPEVGGRHAFGTPKTKGSAREVPISPKLRAILTDHLNTGYANRFNPESLVFTGERGAPVSQANFRKREFQPAAERAKVFNAQGRPPTVHDLRHTAASLWIARGLTPFEVAKMLGHTDLRMIEQRYGHLYVEGLQAKIDALGS
jgi:integrase